METNWAAARTRARHEASSGSGPDRQTTFQTRHKTRPRPAQMAAPSGNDSRLDDDIVSPCRRDSCQPQPLSHNFSATGSRSGTEGIRGKASKKSATAGTNRQRRETAPPRLEFRPMLKRTLDEGGGGGGGEPRFGSSQEADVWMSSAPSININMLWFVAAVR